MTTAKFSPSRTVHVCVWCMCVLGVCARGMCVLVWCVHELNFDSGSHACASSPLPTEPRPQEQYFCDFVFLMIICILQSVVPERCLKKTPDRDFGHQIPNYAVYHQQRNVLNSFSIPQVGVSVLFFRKRKPFLKGW